MGLVGGARTIPQALGLLRRERGLWIWCVLPLLVNLLFFGAAIVVFAHYYDAIAARLGELVAAPDPTGWYQWLWVGPLRLVVWALRWIVVGLFGLAIYFLFTVVGSVIASPFLDLLSQRVELLRTGRVSGTDASLLRSALRVAFEDAKRTIFFLGGQAMLLAVGLIPGLQPISAVAIFVFAALFLSLDYTAYVFDRREISFRRRRSWLWSHSGTLLGFGSTALASFLIPGLNFIALPVLVTAGTTLALELPPEPG